MTRGPFTCFDLIQDELESQYRGKILSQKYILGTLYNKVCNTYPILYTSETIFTFGTICRTHFKLIEMKNLKNVLKSTLRGVNKQNKIQTSYKNQVT